MKVLSLVVDGLERAREDGFVPWAFQQDADIIKMVVITVTPVSPMRDHPLMRDEFLSTLCYYTKLNLQ